MKEAQRSTKKASWSNTSNVARRYLQSGEGEGGSEEGESGEGGDESISEYERNIAEITKRLEAAEAETEK